MATNVMLIILVNVCQILRHVYTIYENMGSPRGKRAGSKECKAAHSTRIPKDYALLFSFIACTA